MFGMTWVPRTMAHSSTAVPLPTRASQLSASHLSGSAAFLGDAAESPLVPLTEGTPSMASAPTARTGISTNGTATTDPPRGSEYATLLRQVKSAGLLERRRGYYITKMVVTGGLLVGGWALFVVLGDSWWQLLVAAFLAIVFAQLGFIAHDAGHRQIFRTGRANYLAGILHTNLAIGLSYGWWVDKHSRHHAHPNHEDRDPDIQIGALASTASQARAKTGPIRFIARHQRYLFLPLL